MPAPLSGGTMPDQHAPKDRPAAVEPPVVSAGMADVPNLLFYGDNLDVLRRHVKDDSVDLIYLDPPFNSNRSYNVLFKSHGAESEAQIAAFDDTWRWSQ